MTLTESEKEKYSYAASLYSREQCLDLIEYLIEAHNKLRTTTFGKIALETILLHVMRSHFRLSIEQLVRHLSELEQLVNEKSLPLVSTEDPPLASVAHPPLEITPVPKPAPLAVQAKPPVVKAPQPPEATLFTSFTTEDPTPSPPDLGKSQKATQPPHRCAALHDS